MKKCDCYHIESKHKYTYHPITREPIKHNTTVGVCWGTKEIDECNCDGDRTKCDFYPEVREKAKVEMGEDNLIVSYDCCPPDAATLCIARKEEGKIKVLHTIHGDEALYTYALLTGNVEWKDLNE